MKTTHRSATCLPHAVFGMLHARSIERCFVILPKVKDGLNVAVFIVWCHGFVADVEESDLLVLSNLGCELQGREITI